MLSGVSQQASPLSSSLALPSLSVPVTMSSSSSGVTALGDNFFLGIQPLGMTDLAELHRGDQTSGNMPRGWVYAHACVCLDWTTLVYFECKKITFLAHHPLLRLVYFVDPLPIRA